MEYNSHFSDVDEDDQGDVDWSNVSNAYDDTDETFASVTLNYQYSNGLIFSGLDSFDFEENTILKVELKFKAKSSINLLQYNEYEYVYIVLLVDDEYVYDSDRDFVTTTTIEEYVFDLTYPMVEAITGKNANSISLGLFAISATGRSATIYIDDVYVTIHYTDKEARQLGIVCYDDQSEEVFNSTSIRTMILLHQEVVGTGSYSKHIFIDNLSLYGNRIFVISQPVDESKGVGHAINSVTKDFDNNYIDFDVDSISEVSPAVPATKSIISIIGY